MSGGAFDGRQYAIQSLVDDIDEVINKRELPYSPDTLAEFENAKRALWKAFTYVQRIDWLISGDDSEETFHKRLREDLGKLQ